MQLGKVKSIYRMAEKFLPAFNSVWLAILAIYVVFQFELPEKQMNNQKGIVELEKLKATPIKFSQNIDIGSYFDKRFPNAYEMTYSYSLENSSNQKLQILGVVIRSYLMAQINLTDAAITEMPAPGSDTNWWTLAHENIYTSGGDEILKEKIVGGAKELHSSFNVDTVDLDAGEKCWNSIHLILKNERFKRVGITLDVRLRFKDSTLKWTSSTMSALILPGSYSGEPIK